jgi:phage antirepressor YoqD-like protein
MVMSESYEVQAKVYDRMTELTAQIAPSFDLPNFLDPAEAAIAWATEYRAKENALAVVEAQTTLLIQQIDKIAVQAKKIVTQAPDVDFVAKYVTGEGNKTFRCVAKLLSIKENAFRTFLVDNKIMYKLNKEWMPCSGYKRDKYFEVKTDFFYGTVCSTTLFTPAGIVWIAKQYTKALLRDNMGLAETFS